MRVARIVRVGEREREPRDGRRARGRQSQQNIAADLLKGAKKNLLLSSSLISLKMNEGIVRFIVAHTTESVECVSRCKAHSRSPTKFDRRKS